MEEAGLPQRDVIAKIKNYLVKDAKYESGKIMSSVCTKPPYIAKQAFMRGIDKNLGDPFLFSGTAEIEKDIIRMIGSLLSCPDAVGYILSGGTEANILALWVARNLSKKENPEVIAPRSAHFSIDKASDLLRIKLIKTPIGNDHRADIRAIEDNLTDRTIAIVGTAGTSGLGAVDPIPEMSDLAVKHGTYLHVDAAFGGFILPFLKDIGYPSYEFDFKLPGVCSITVDPHKMGMAPIPSGGILFRDKSMLEALNTELPYSTAGKVKHLQATIIGTRPGSSVIATWALLKHLGKEGYRKVVKRCMDLSYMLASRLKSIEEIELLSDPPVMTMVGFRPRTMSIDLFLEKMNEKGWKLIAYDGIVRVVVMPHLKKVQINRLLDDLIEILKFRK